MTLFPFPLFFSSRSSRPRLFFFLFPVSLRHSILDCSSVMGIREEKLLPHRRNYAGLPPLLFWGGGFARVGGISGTFFSFPLFFLPTRNNARNMVERFFSLPPPLRDQHLLRTFSFLYIVGASKLFPPPFLPRAPFSGWTPLSFNSPVFSFLFMR